MVPDDNDALDRIKQLVRSGAAFSAPDVQEIRPEIRSAGTWHLVDPARNPPDATTALVTKGMEQNYLLGMLVRQVSYYVPPERVVAFQGWLFRIEPVLCVAAEKIGVSYRGTYGVFGRSGGYTTLWGYRSFDAIQAFSNAVADVDSDLGDMLREFQDYTDQSDPARYQEQLWMPAASGRFLISEARRPKSAKAKAKARQRNRTQDSAT